MAQNINLIPQAEVAQQVKVRIVKLSTIISILLLLVVAGVAAYFFYTVKGVRDEIVATEGRIENERQEIIKLANIEINSRILYAKSSTLRAILSQRQYFSKLLTELAASVPESVLIKDFNITENSTITLTGMGGSYNSIQEFMNNLLAKEIFTQVELNSVSLDSREDGVNYFLVATYDARFLHE